MECEINPANLAFRSRLKMLAEKLGGVSGLARAAGFNESTVRQWVDGPAEPNRTKLVAIATVAGVDVGWLATGQGPRTPDAPQEVLGVGEGSPVATAPPAPPPGRAARQQQSQTRATPAPGADAGPAAGRSLSISMIAPPAPAVPDRGEFANLPLLARCLDAVQRLPAALSTEQRLALALRLAEALVYLAADQPVPPALDPDALLALARLLYQLHPPTGDPGPGP